MRSTFGSRLPLSRAALDRDHLARTRTVDELLADPKARAVVLHEGRALLEPGRPEHPALALLPPTALPSVALPDPASVLYLGRTLVAGRDAPAGTPVLALLLDDAGRTAVEASLSGAAKGDAADCWGDLRHLGALLDDRDAGLFTQALALANWHGAYGFSPRTGAATIVEQAGWIRRDPETDAVFFPRTDAAVIVGVTDADDRLLLGSNAMWDANRYSVLAGFVEPGESLEAAVIREVREESRLTVAEPEYLGSQPWPFPASLMVGFRARLAPGQDPDAVPDGDEIIDLRWVTRAELAAALADIRLPGPTSIARAIIEDWYGAELDDGQQVPRPARSRVDGPLSEGAS